MNRKMTLEKLSSRIPAIVNPIRIISIDYPVNEGTYFKLKKIEVHMTAIQNHIAHDLNPAHEGNRRVLAILNGIDFTAEKIKKYLREVQSVELRIQFRKEALKVVQFEAEYLRGYAKRLQKHI